MKTLLVNPPIPTSFYNREYYLPSGLLYLGAVLQKKEDNVKLADLKTFQGRGEEPTRQFYESKLVEIMQDFQPDLIGIGSLFSGNFPDVLNLSKKAKQEAQDVPVVIGGIHPTLYAREILENCPSVDYIVLAEGEDSIVTLAEAIKKNKNLSEIDGLAFRKDSKVVVNPKVGYIKDVDAIPFPAYDLVDLEDYYTDTSRWHNPKQLPINTSIPIITSRSCPNRCTFCSMYEIMGPRWRARSPKNVVDEIEYLYKKYNQRHFSFMDDNLTLNKQRIIDICNGIVERKLDIQFETPNGVSINTLDKKVLDAMVSAGFIRTYLAIESGSDYMRNTVMKKNLSREKIYEVLDLVKNYKELQTNAFFIIGMPEETKETLEDTFEMIKRVDAHKTLIMNIVPFPGTKVFEQASRDNLLVDVDVKNLYTATDFYFTNYDRFFIKPYNLSIDDLRGFRKRCDNLLEGRKYSKTKTLGEKNG